MSMRRQLSHLNRVLNYSLVYIQQCQWEYSPVHLLWLVEKRHKTEYLHKTNFFPFPHHTRLTRILSSLNIISLFLPSKSFLRRADSVDIGSEALSLCSAALSFNQRNSWNIYIYQDALICHGWMPLVMYFSPHSQDSVIYVVLVSTMSSWLHHDQNMQGLLALSLLAVIWFRLSNSARRLFSSLILSEFLFRLSLNFGIRSSSSEALYPASWFDR